MKMKCEMTAEDVYKIIGDELTRKGINWSELIPVIRPSMVFDLPDTFEGMTFQVEFKN